MARLTTSQSIRIADLEAALRAGATPATPSFRDREEYADLIARFSPPEERDSEEARFAHRRYAKIMAMDGGHHLQAALNLLSRGQTLTGAEVAAIVVGASAGTAPLSALERLLDEPALLPHPAVEAELCACLRESDDLNLIVLADRGR